MPFNGGPGCNREMLPSDINATRTDQNATRADANVIAILPGRAQ